MHESFTSRPGTVWATRPHGLHRPTRLEDGPEVWGDAWEEGPPGRGLAIGLGLSLLLWAMLGGLFWLGECVLTGGC